MKTILISAPQSNTGKTTLTLGIIRALKKRGLEVSPFKVGPDYIDSSYQALSAGRTSRNLDLFLEGDCGVRENLNRANGDIAVIEGVMGYFDGLKNTATYSSYDLSKRFSIPSILVYRPSGEMFSMVPKIKGMVDYEGSMIRGAILNMCGKKTYEMAREIIEKHVGIPVLGYLPKDEFLEIKSRHLGLLRPFEIEDIDEKIERVANLIEEHIDLEKLLSIAGEFEKSSYRALEPKNIKIAVAKDECFSFNYTANLEIYSELGEVEFFSPLEDEKIPDCDLLIIGGGYPELYLDSLSKNNSMIESIRSYVEDGGYGIFYGGGFMYLSNSIDNVPMVSLFDGDTKMEKSLRHFGYSYLNVDSGFFKTTDMRVREFHKSSFTLRENAKTQIVGRLNKPGDENCWEDAYAYKNAYGMFAHFHALGIKDKLKEIVENINVYKATHENRR